MRRGQPRRLGGAGGEHDGVEAFAVDLPAAAPRGESADARAEVQPCAVPAQKAHRRVGPQRTQVDGRQQQVRRPRAAEQRVAQQAQEDRRAGLAGGGVERGDGERVDQLVAHPARQPRGEGGDAQTGVAAKAAPRPAGGRGEQRQPLGEAPAARGEHAAHERGRGRAARQRQAAAVGVAQGERQAQQARRRVDADARQQLERLHAGAEQDVLAVVEREAVALDAPRAPAGLRRHLVQRDRVAARGGLDRGGEAGPAGADDGDAASPGSGGEAASPRPPHPAGGRARVAGRRQRRHG